MTNSERIRKVQKLLGIKLPDDIDEDKYEYIPAGEPCEEGDGWQCWDTDGGNWWTSRSSEMRRTHLCRRLKLVRWRAAENEIYYFVSASGCVISDQDLYVLSDNDRYKFGNYFRTRGQAEEALRRTLQVWAEYQQELLKESRA